jgi:hypothetical protein
VPVSGIDNEDFIFSPPIRASRTHLPACSQQCLLEKQHIKFSEPNFYTHRDAVDIDHEFYAYADDLSACDRISFCGRAAADA